MCGVGASYKEDALGMILEIKIFLVELHLRRADDRVLAYLVSAELFGPLSMLVKATLPSSLIREITGCVPFEISARRVTKSLLVHFILLHGDFL